MENIQAFSTSSLVYSGVGGCSVSSTALESVRQLAALIIALELHWPAPVQQAPTSTKSTQTEQQEASTQVIGSTATLALSEPVLDALSLSPGTSAHPLRLGEAKLFPAAPAAQLDEQLARLRAELERATKEAYELRANNGALNERVNRLQDVRSSRDTRYCAKLNCGVLYFTVLY